MRIILLIDLRNNNNNGEELEKGLIRDLYTSIVSSGSRNFKTGGRGPGAVEFLGLGFVLMPLHTYSMCL